MCPRNRAYLLSQTHDKQHNVQVHIFFDNCQNIDDVGLVFHDYENLGNSYLYCRLRLRRMYGSQVWPVRRKGVDRLYHLCVGLDVQVFERLLFSMPMSITFSKGALSG